MTDNSSSFRSPLASWTLEVPQNSPTNLVVLTSFDEHILGKQDPMRQDRQGSMMLPCCSPGKFSSPATIGVADGSPPLANAQAIFFGFGRIRHFDNLRIYINEESEKPSTGKLLAVENNNGSWPCMWNFNFYHSYWLLLENEEEELSTISLCVESTQCTEGQSSEMMLVSAAVY